ncbi:hypothetical protein GCM10008965_02430 [Methylorubrum aminovorans]|nr:hypothetical protein GCM10025880_24430 [Methylorubrum aminovorans]
MNRLERPDPHHLRDAQGVVAVGLVDARREGGVHVTGLDADRQQPDLDQAGVEPRRERSRLQADPRVGMAEIDQMPADHLGVALDSGAVHDLAVGIDDANRCLLHGDIEADVVLLVHGGAPRLNRSAILPPLPPRQAPRIPHLAPERCRQAVDGIREKYGLSERHVCRIVGYHRDTQRYVPTVLADEDALTRAIVALAPSTSAMATAASPRCCKQTAGRWARTGFSVSGVARG